MADTHSSQSHPPTVEGRQETQADVPVAERHFMPVFARIPAVFLAVLSYVVVMITSLLLVYATSVQPLMKFMNATSSLPMKGSSHTVCGLWTNAFLLIGFALLHSGLAACGFFRSFAGPLHRCLYNVTTCAYILVSYLYWTPTPSLLLWDASTLFWLQMLFILLHVHTWSCLALSLLSFDHLEFLGLPQVLLGSNPLIHKSVHLQKLYLGLRHPALVLPCILLWAVPTMSFDRLVLAIFLPLYMIWGSTLDKEDSDYTRQEFCSKLKSNFCPGSREKEE